MLRTTSNVLDAVALERLFKLGSSAPDGVLPTVVGQHLFRLAVRREASLERLHHQCGFLMVRDRVADDESTVVVHEHAQIKPLLSALEEREDV
jgi:hypothetical protein